MDKHIATLEFVRNHTSRTSEEIASLDAAIALMRGQSESYPLWLIYNGDEFLNSRKRLPGESYDAGLKGFLRGAVRSLKEAKRQGYRVVEGHAIPAPPKDTADEQ